jgi:hypothetical protein
MMNRLGRAVTAAFVLAIALGMAADAQTLRGGVLRMAFTVGRHLAQQRADEPARRHHDGHEGLQRPARVRLGLRAGIAILVTVLSINLVGDGLNDALNPRTTTVATAAGSGESTQVAASLPESAPRAPIAAGS